MTYLRVVREYHAASLGGGRLGGGRLGEFRELGRGGVDGGGAPKLLA